MEGSWGEAGFLGRGAICSCSTAGLQVHALVSHLFSRRRQAWLCFTLVARDCADKRLAAEAVCSCKPIKGVAVCRSLIRNYKIANPWAKRAAAGAVPTNSSDNRAQCTICSMCTCSAHGGVCHCAHSTSPTAERSHLACGRSCCSCCGGSCGGSGCCGCCTWWKADNCCMLVGGMWEVGG